MKKFTLALAALVLVGPAFAANTIKMVSYFPIPYASYSDIAVDGTCDVGLLNQCSMSVPSWTIADNTDLNGSGEFTAGDMIVKTGPLSLNSSYSASQVSGEELLVGLGTHGAATLIFDGNLKVTKAMLDVLDPMLPDLRGLEATTKANIKSLTLGTYAFPACTKSNREGTISNYITWQRLDVDGTDRVYLTCGEGAQLAIPCEGENERRCGCGRLFMNYTWGKQTRTCDTTTGQWNEWGECTGYTTKDRQQCSAGGNEEYECRKQSDGRYDWVQIEWCEEEPEPSTGGYGWVATNTQTCYNCGSCPTKTASCSSASDVGNTKYADCYDDSDTGVYPDKTGYIWTYTIYTCKKI